MIMVVVETARGVTTRVRFLRVLTSSVPEWNALLPESPKSCQHYFEALTTDPLLLELCWNELARRGTTRKTVARAASGLLISACLDHRSPPMLSTLMLSSL